MANTNVSDYVTISSTGDASDFGDLSASITALAGLSSSTRGVFGGGTNGSVVNVMEYITIGRTGNVTDFGDLLAATRYSSGLAGST